MFVEVPHISNGIEASTCTIHSCVHMNAQNMSFIFHSLVGSWTVQLSLVTVLMLLYDNIGLMLACLPSGSTDVTASAGQYMTQPSGCLVSCTFYACWRSPF